VKAAVRFGLRRPWPVDILVNDVRRRHGRPYLEGQGRGLDFIMRSTCARRSCHARVGGHMRERRSGRIVNLISVAREVHAVDSLLTLHSPTVF